MSLEKLGRRAWGKLALVGCVSIGLVSRRSLGWEPVADGASALRELRQWLRLDAARRTPLAEQPFASESLNAAQAKQAAELLAVDRGEQLKSSAQESFTEGVVRVGESSMKFAYRRFGNPGPNGRSLYISMHGGGGAPPAVNDQQWENQKRLYEPAEGIYVAPRAPGDTWDLWHTASIDPLFDELIKQMIVFEQVDPNRVYLMGYSAGGDGVYQVAPRMADRFAAAAMMAGHPNESVALGLRNLPFAIYCGGDDSAYRRNEIAAEWGQKLDELQAADQGGYVHRTVIYPGKGHWMDREDREAVPWMAEHTRNLRPDRIVWQQDDVIETRFYWLGMSREDAQDRTLVEVHREGNTFTVARASKAFKLTIHFDDELIDFDQPVRVVQGSDVLFEGSVTRTIKAIDQSLSERFDPTGVFMAQVAVDVSAAP